MNMTRETKFRNFWVMTLVLAGCAGPRTEPTPEASRDPAAAGDEFFNSEKLYYVRITNWNPQWMTPASLNEDRKVADAKFEIFAAHPKSKIHCPDAESGTPLFSATGIEMSTSGNMTNGTPKSSYKIDTGDAEFHGMKKFNLKSMWNDVSQMREAIAWRMFREAKVPASRHTYAKFCVNGKYFGLYSVIENIDKPMLKNRFPGLSDGNLYKANWSVKDLGAATLETKPEYCKPAVKIADRTYELRTNKNKDAEKCVNGAYEDLAKFIATLNGLPEAQSNASFFASADYAKRMRDLFDVEGFLRWAAVSNLLGAWDNYWATPSNYFLYNENLADPYFRWIPWDYDHSFGIRYNSADWQNASLTEWEEATRAYHGGSKTSKLPLIRNVLKNPEFAAYYHDYVEHLLERYFRRDWIDARVEKYWAVVAEAAYLESDSPAGPPHTGRQFTNDQVYWNGYKHDRLRKGSADILGIRHHVIMRAGSAKKQLKAWRVNHPRQNQF